MSHSRARSKEAKQKQTELIINTARELFYEAGAFGFSMRILAKRLDMSQGNLYNYWTSKRDLWYNILEQDFQEFEGQMLKIIKTHKGSYMSLLEKLAEYYFIFARDDYQKYQMMFVTIPPPAEKKGRKERDFEPKTIHILMGIVQEAVESGELDLDNILHFTLYLWSVIHGTVLVSKSILFDTNSELSTFGDADTFLTYVTTILKKQIAAYSKLDI
jgi:AcrR family transcriptional regulator